jgi:hypothetical protein
LIDLGDVSRCGGCERIGHQAGVVGDLIRRGVGQLLERLGRIVEGVPAPRVEFGEGLGRVAEGVIAAARTTREGE